MSNKKVRTKLIKDSRIEFRCTKAFKAQLEEIAVHHNLGLSGFIESLCVDAIKQHLPKGVPVASPVRTNPEKPPQDNNPQAKAVHTKDELIAMCAAHKANGLTYAKSAALMNEQGIKPLRSDTFTVASVKSLAEQAR